MPTQKKPGWQTSLIRVGTGVTTTAIAGALTLLIWMRLLSRSNSPSLAFVLALLTFIGLSFALYRLWYWIFFKRSAEIADKLLLGGKERRRRREEFYSNLPK